MNLFLYMEINEKKYLFNKVDEFYSSYEKYKDS